MEPLWDMGVSENSVALNPMVNDHYPYEKWLFHWEYTQHFQTNPHSISQWSMGPLRCPDAPCPGLKAFEIFPNAFVVCEVDTSAMRIA